MRTFCLLTVGLLVAGAMPATAQEDTPEPGIYNPNESTPTKMFFHINGFQDFPTNTQKPDDSFVANPNLGLATHSGCVPDNPATTFGGTSSHTWYGYSSPGYVEYDVEENGQPRYHPERGISFDVDLDESVPPVFTWYLSTQIFAGNANDPVPDPNQVPVVVPNVVLRATIREGDAISVGHEALNQGELIAQAQTAPAHLAADSTVSDDGSVSYQGTVDGQHIYKFEFPLDYNRASIDAEESYNIRVDVFMDNPACGEPEGWEDGSYLMLDWVRIHTSPEYRPQLQWNVMNPLRIEFLHPQFIGDDLVVHTSTNSPWGNYDVRGDQASEAQGGLELEITGPTPALSLERVALTARTHEHDHHTEAVDATWVWNYQADNAKQGLYNVVFNVKNDQETAEALAVAQFEIGSGRVTGCGGQQENQAGGCFDDVQPDGGAKSSEESPGFGVIAGLAILGAIAAVLRRRR